jgi:D-sedoheptulose 7-phosphate isomerase
VNSAGAAAVSRHIEQHQLVIGQMLAKARGPIVLATDALIAAIKDNRKVITFGNGGSAAQASHLAGELVGRYSVTRRAVPAIALGCDPSVVTGIANDFGYTALFARQLEALVDVGDVAIGFTASGKSENVRLGLDTAAARGAITIALTGIVGIEGGNAPIVVAVPSTVTAHVQEAHLIVIHIWCDAIDRVLNSALSSTSTCRENAE